MNALKTVIMLSLLSLPVMNTAFADDSTNISAPGVTPVLPQNEVNYSNCTLSKVIQSSALGTKGPQSSSCPPNYVAIGLKINVIFVKDETQWQTECCPSFVGYAN